MSNCYTVVDCFPVGGGGGGGVSDFGSFAGAVRVEI